MIVFLTTLLILLCIAVVLLILIQRTSGGMGSALGGGAADQYLGAGSAAQLSKLTVWAILFFFVLSFGLYALYQSEAGVGDDLLRSGNVAPSINPNDLNLPESPSAELPANDALEADTSTNQIDSTTAESQAIPEPTQPVSSGNATE